MIRDGLDSPKEHPSPFVKKILLSASVRISSLAFIPFSAICNE